MKKKTPTKIIEEELTRLGEIVYEDTRQNVRVSKDTFAKNGEPINRGGSLRDSVLPFAKGKRLIMSQLFYGKWQKPKELGSIPWNPPASPTSELWDNPMATSIAQNIPNTINVISKSLIKSIVSNDK
jgi:hypothetical protein